MFSRITGTLLERDGDVVRVDVGGLTYDITLPPSVAGKIESASGAPVALEVYAQLQIDGNAGRYVFFGFTNTVEREFFEALISVAGVGPKAASRAFSAPMGRIARAIDAGDHVFLKTLPGIGQQKARDIVAKLQGKVGRFLLIQDAPVRPEPPAMPDFAAEALAVLLQLAYRRPEAEAMINETLVAAPQLRDAEALLAEIYRQRNKTGSAS
ncbi:MAG TPA: Holliday junction branch migration protein RuvA [Candidatus Lustribacter sp.]|jgi:Holliday junction DNA helicase RuvA|nr:Holliday junction branch migration protein RuvA [Candidatus Lustribacter sp.]